MVSSPTDLMFLSKSYKNRSSSQASTPMTFKSTHDRKLSYIDKVIRRTNMKIEHGSENIVPMLNMTPTEIIQS